MVLGINIRSMMINENDSVWYKNENVGGSEWSKNKNSKHND